MGTLNNSPRRQELIAIAANLFYEQGYERTTVRMLADAMGIKSGSLFHHFKDKQEILYAVIESAMEHALSVGTQVLEQQRTPREQLRALVQAHLQALLADRNAHVVARYEWRSLTPDTKRRLIGMRDEYEAVWHRVISDCIQQGILHGDPPLVRRFILGALNWTIQWYDTAGEKSIEDLTDALLAMLQAAPPAQSA